MAKETQNELLKMCKSLALSITNPPEDWFEEHEVLDIEYTISRDGTYLGAQLLMTFGGPNIYINTRRREVEGYWGAEKVTAAYYLDNVGLDDWFAEEYEASR